MKKVFHGNPNSYQLVQDFATIHNISRDFRGTNGHITVGMMLFFRTWKYHEISLLVREWNFHINVTVGMRLGKTML